MNLKQAEKCLKQHRDRMAKERDKLNDFIYELKTDRDRYDDVIDSLNDAIDRLSEVV